ncbi:uncharacterized protein MELLADRAFT_76332 [Melampsora larici-populina 98AG31]|uniref:Uncharacterized protein n=1 Tax=Melampsora larici-populina (strain 98AG31 / pathotype 3-4-7) TaxID=747676 RepID=F4R479_MELLP|nr:uncharacterized protein MELLADRAFT_76332 [Melampsora larici-populina 98AG31]EGG13043.1 hypothetical protein MELLADRAFT_76332 [Melampsora larici-populina 98AG31]
MTKQKPKYRAKSTQLKRSKDHKDRLIAKSVEKKTQLPTPPPDPPTVASATQSTTSNRARKRKTFKEKVKKKFGLPDDVTFIHQANHGKNKPLTLKTGTAVILNLNGTKLITVIRFNTQQYIQSNGKKVQTEDSEQLFKQFGRSISTLYNHGVARNQITTNGPTVALGKRKRGDMFAIGMRAGYWKGVFGGVYLCIFCIFILFPSDNLRNI